MTAPKSPSWWPGRSLKRYRQAAGLSIAQAAQALNLAEDTLTKLESSRLFLPVGMVAKLGKVYKLPFEEQVGLMQMTVELAQAKPDFVISEHGDSGSEQGARREEQSRWEGLGRGLAALIPPPPALSGAGIFISYRRSDQPALAGRLYDKLVTKFGDAQIFMDVDSIDLGLDFVEVLNETIAGCSVLIVVIGRDWLNATDEGGTRRIDQPDDFVRLEIEIALQRNIRVIPILVDGTRMPRATELPESIRGLSRRNGRDIWNARFNSDCLELISTLERLLDEDRPAELRSATTDVPRYIRDVHNRLLQLADAAIGDQLETARTEAHVDGTDFVTIMAPTRRPNAEFALKVVWGMDNPRLFRQISIARLWMRNRELPGIIATRQYPTDEMIDQLDLGDNERPVQLLLWRGSQDDEALKLCLWRIAGER